MTDQAVPPPAPAAASEDKTVAIVSYLTIIGFIIAIIIHQNKKTKIGTYHLRQALGLVLAGVAVGVVGVIPILGWIVALIGMPVLFVLWIIALVYAIQGQFKPVPLIGQLFEKWFANTFE